MRPISKKQSWEKENVEWFAIGILKRFKEPSDEDFEEYLKHSERGVSLKKRAYGDFNWYVEAKRWRGITIHEFWENSLYGGGWFGWYNLLREEDGSPIPRHVKDYITKEIFRGQDKELIDKTYEVICNNLPE